MQIRIPVPVFVIFSSISSFLERCPLPFLLWKMGHLLAGSDQEQQAEINSGSRLFPCHSRFHLSAVLSSLAFH